MNIFVEFERIRKPSKHAQSTGRMLCLLVNAFREKQYKDDFQSWSSVIHFVCSNVNRFSQEVLALKNKILDQHSPQQILRCKAIYQEYFSDCKLPVFLNHVSNKILKDLAILVYNSLVYVLSKDPSFRADDSYFDHNPLHTDETPQST